MFLYFHFILYSNRMSVVVVVALVLAAIVIPTAVVSTNNKKVNDEWNAFKEEFYKTYDTEDGDELRLVF